MLEAQKLSKAGNTAQIEFCGKHEIALSNTKSAITIKKDTDSALQYTEEAEPLIAERKCKICIADSKQAGWATVAHLDKDNRAHTRPTE